MRKGSVKMRQRVIRVKWLNGYHGLKGEGRGKQPLSRSALTADPVSSERKKALTETTTVVLPAFLFFIRFCDANARQTTATSAPLCHVTQSRVNPTGRGKVSSASSASSDGCRDLGARQTLEKQNLIHVHCSFNYSRNRRFER